MMKRRTLLLLGVVSLFSGLVPWRVSAHHGRDERRADGAVFTLGNQAEGNQVFAFARRADGGLTAPVAFDSGGSGLGASLSSQGALVLTEDRRFLLVVNAGSSDISSFAVRGAALELRDTIASGGERPVSITERHGRVYVVNAGSANVAGFWLDPWGGLHTLPDSVQPLSSASASPGQVELSPDGRFVVVTERATNLIATFAVDWRGGLAQARFEPSEGSTPFGFGITRKNQLVVSEAATRSASSYRLERDGSLGVLSSVVADTQTAPCWVVLSADDRYAFVANAGSSSISSYAVARDGTIELVDPVAGDVGPLSRPLDMAVDRKGVYLYVLDRGNAGVAGFELASDGTLESLDFAAGLPAFATGLAAY